MNYLARLMAITHTTVTAVDSTPARRKPVGGPWLLLSPCLWLGTGQSIAASASTTLSGFASPTSHPAAYSGTVILMPFWTTGSTPCLRVIPAFVHIFGGGHRGL